MDKPLDNIRITSNIYNILIHVCTLMDALHRKNKIHTVQPVYIMTPYTLAKPTNLCALSFKH